MIDLIRPVDLDDDVTQEESYVVVCVEESYVFVGGSQLDRQDKKKSISILPPSTILFRRFEMGRTMLFVEESLHEICYSKK